MREDNQQSCKYLDPMSSCAYTTWLYRFTLIIENAAVKQNFVMMKLNVL